MSKTGTLDGNSILRQNELDLIARFKDIKSINSTLTQRQLAKEFSYSDCTLKDKEMS